MTGPIETPGGPEAPVPARGPMRVALISRGGAMQALWLPEAAEGRWRFRGAEVPVYMESRDGAWTAHAEKGASLYADGGAACRKLPLAPEQALQLRCPGGEYALYTERIRPGDGIFVPYRLDERLQYTIGRKPDCQICYPNRAVSREHARLYWSEGAWHIADCGSANGTYVNGSRVQTARLANGDAVYIMGLCLLAGPGFFSINNANGRVGFHTNGIRRVSGAYELASPPCPETRASRGTFDRQPRRRVAVRPEKIAIDNPPLPLMASKIPLLLRMGSPMVMGGRALATGNILMVLTSLVFPALTQGLTEKDRREYEEKRVQVYRQYLAEKERELLREKQREEQLLDETYPNLSAALDFARAKKRLWERRNTDEDFLSLRLGAGRLPLLAEREYSERSFELERDMLKEEMYALAERPVFLENVPVLLSLQTDFIVGVQGFSPEHAWLPASLAMQLALTHSYDEVKLVLLLEEPYTSEFAFARYLPHCWDNERTVRFFAAGRSDALQLSEYLSREIEAMLDPDLRKTRRERTAYVVFALSKGLFDCIESFKDVLRQEEYCGVSILAAFEGIPKECSQILDLRRKPRLVPMSAPGEPERYFTPDYFDRPKAREAMRELMRTKLALSQQARSLPETVTFLELFGAGRAEHLNPLRRWAENNPVKSLAVPIGVGADGKPFTLDLHEKQQGPHGLVAGMTGSGKSEFLITYILSMAVSFSPDEAAFILIDYKGGGLADAFENKERGIHLPHLAGVITNLDGAAIERSLMSIKSELTRRQTVFKEVKQRLGEGTLDIYDYQKLYRSRKVGEPMPHLFIISDEFAELKQQQPMFMDELISAARIGRSLGVHLILATQKPGGVVNNQIWSNTRFRACLRVQDRGDSMEMLKRPEAAELRETGRFYLQVGYNEYFAIGQSAWCGADYVPQDEVIEEPDDSVRFLDNTGKTLLTVRPETERPQAECRQIAAVVRYLSELARREGLAPRSLWTEPLPGHLELSALLEQAPPPPGRGITAVLGMVDDPELQRQFPLHLYLQEFHNLLVAGNAGSGKSTLLRTLLYSLVSRYSPAEVQYYLVDLSDGALGGYSRLPHCGAYLDDRQTAELGRLMDLIGDIIAQRKALFAELEAEDFAACCRVRPIPLILFLVDGFTKIRGLEGGESFFLKLPGYLREGFPYGIRFVVSCNHSNEVGIQSRQEMDRRLALQAKDHYEYSDILGVRCKSSPPELEGRGVCVWEGRPLAYQAAMLDCAEDGLRRASLLRARLERIALRDQGVPPARRLPMLDDGQTYEDFCRGFPPARVPLGYAVKDMKPVAVPLQQLHSMSIYFGNPKGIRPVFRNLLCAARRDGMEVLIVRRPTESVFDPLDGEDALLPDGANVSLLECTKEGLEQLAERILSEIVARNVHRDAYSVQQGIPLESKGRSKKAAKYIRAHTVPLLVILESFADFCRAEHDEELYGKFTVFFGMMRGYNIYFAAGFYPDDGNLSGHELMKQYNKEELFLLFGGRYDRSSIRGLPYEITKYDKLVPEYNQFLLKYQDGFHPMVMPCGSLREPTGDPDEDPIL